MSKQTLVEGVVIEEVREFWRFGGTFFISTGGHNDELIAREYETEAEAAQAMLMLQEELKRIGKHIWLVPTAYKTEA